MIHTATGITDINQEVLRQLGYIEGDELLMRKVLAAIKRIVARQKTSVSAYQPRSKKELLSDFREALAETKAYQQNPQPFVPAENLLDEL